MAAHFSRLAELCCVALFTRLENISECVNRERVY